MPIGNRRVGYKPNDECYTPEWVFTALKVEFDLDVASPEGGIEYIPAKQYFTQSDDGLTREWFGRVWMNPPYSQPTDWVNKWLDHKNGFALLPVSKSAWYSNMWNSDAQCVAMPYNIRFIKPDKSKLSIFMPCHLWAIGETNITALKMSGLGRIR